MALAFASLCKLSISTSKGNCACGISSPTEDNSSSRTNLVLVKHAGAQKAPFTLARPGSLYYFFSQAEGVHTGSLSPKNNKPGRVEPTPSPPSANS
eukprot:256354-Pelagomonas_calceolata.AAC.2